MFFIKYFVRTNSAVYCKIIDYVYILYIGAYLLFFRISRCVVKSFQWYMITRVGIFMGVLYAHSEIQRICFMYRPLVTSLQSCSFVRQFDIPDLNLTSVDACNMHTKISHISTHAHGCSMVHNICHVFIVLYNINIIIVRCSVIVLGDLNVSMTCRLLIHSAENEILLNVRGVLKHK